jgi:LuxR family maltose regulon positive regulatory protein
MCAHGIEEMLADAERALDELPRDDRWYPYGLLLQGTAAGLAGEIDRAGAILSHAARAAERTGATETRVLALAERALLADERGSLAAAREAAAAGGLEAYPSFGLTLALTAQEHLRGGRWHEAQSALTHARAVLPALTAALPWLAVQTRLELAAAHVMLAVRPRLGRLRTQRRQLTAEIGSIPAKPEGSTARLTGAELRLLPLLGTHLSFREIGGRLFLSRHTVKTQAISAYRKLGASSRREAVLCAVDLGLIGADASSTAGP